MKVTENSKEEIIVDKTKFINSQGVPRISGMFWETCYFHYRETAPYTFNYTDIVEGGRTFISIFRLYLEENDVGEYKFATKYFLSWDQWEKITQNAKCKPYIALMRKELSIKIRSNAINTIIDKAKSEVNAAKYVAEVGWEKRYKGQRKTKEQKKEEADLLKVVSKDIENAGITVQ